MLIEDLLRRTIVENPNFPKKGIFFKDISPVVNNSFVFKQVINSFSKIIKGLKIKKIVGIDARGFLFAAPVSYNQKVGLVMVRKKGKLPGKTTSVTYKKEYGTGTLQIQRGSVIKGEKIVVVDDVLATGGTALATCKLVEKLGGKIEKLIFLIELTNLNGRKRLQKYKVESLVKYEL